MTEDARKLSIIHSADTTELDDFFSCHDKAEQQDLTLEEAAKRLNLSERTVQRRLKQGHIKGYKTTGPRGPEWRIQLSSSDDTTTSGAQTSEDTTYVEALSSEDMTADNKSQANLAYVQFVEFYRDQVEALQEKLEAATYRNGYLEAQLSSAESQLKLLPDLSAKAIRTETLEQQIGRLESELVAARRNWWVRFGSWFIGQR